MSTQYPTRTSKTWRPSSGRDEPFDLKREIWRSPVEGQVVFPIIYRVSTPSKRWLGMGFQPSTVGIQLQRFTGKNLEIYWAIFWEMSVESLLFKTFLQKSGMIFTNSANWNVKLWEGWPKIQQIHCSQASIHSDWWKRMVGQDSRYKILNSHTPHKNSH